VSSQLSARAHHASTLRRASVLSVLAAAAGCLALAVRAPGAAGPVVTAVVGIGALAIPVTADRTTATRWERLGILLLGAAAFAAVALRAGLVGPAASIGAVVAGTLAAVAEEALFRRSLYGRLARVGPAVAIAVSAVAFAAVHVPGYGLGSIPVNLSAGLVLGWQRWASGSWGVPAATHVLANLVQLRW
jgi:membrane protease YdiL (CAAX protease family)